MIKKSIGSTLITTTSPYGQCTLSKVIWLNNRF
nr:MAG TPA: hypothetical protein [Caudoviricetes sp.]